MATLLKNLHLQALAASDVVELMPGDVAIGLAGDKMKTLLGSCVSVILTDPRRTVGTMCHIVHVGIPNAANRHNTAYGVAAMHEMFKLLRGKGVNPQMCQAYVYGGGNRFPSLVTSTHVGQSNVDWVLDYLHHHGINIVDHHLGGQGYRKLFWAVGPEPPQLEMVQA